MMDDSVSRQAVVKIVDEIDTFVGGWRDYAIEQINQLPSEERKGYWIDMGDFEQCSVCTGTRLKEFQTYYGKAIWIRTPYCPNCGARMGGGA